MGNKGKFIAGILVLALGTLVLCVASSTAVHDFIVSALSGN